MQQWLGISLVFIAAMLILLTFYCAEKFEATCPKATYSNGQYIIDVGNQYTSFDNIDTAVSEWKREYPACSVPSSWEPCPSGVNNDGVYSVQTIDQHLLFGNNNIDALKRWKKDYPHCPIPESWVSLTAISESETEPSSSPEVPDVSFSPNPKIKGAVICHLIEYTEPPVESTETFRIHGGGGMGGRGGGGMGGGGGWSGRPWRRWPYQYYNRPWDSYLWLNDPYIYTYPLSYYNDYWEEPIQRFSVRIGPKGDRHPLAGSDVGYMITAGAGAGSGMGCGTSGARLDLQYGKTYEFDIYTSKDCITGEQHDEPFFFTTDPMGGARVGEIFEINPTVNGTIRITITTNIPDQFYYQSTNGTGVGGHVFVHA